MILEKISKYLKYNNICGIPLELKCNYIYSLYEKESILVVCNSLYKATQMYNYLKNYTDQVWLFPMDDFLTSEIIAVSPELQIARIELLDSLKSDSKKIIITNLMGYVKFLPEAKSFYSKYIKIKLDQDYEIKKLINDLSDLGYTKETIVNKSGEFAVRGFVVDVFSIGRENPVRIEFWGDTISSIREFDVDSQLKINELETIEIIPNDDLGFTSSLRNYLTKYKIIFNEIDEVLEGYAVLENEIKEYCLDSNQSLERKYISDLIIDKEDISLSEIDSNYLDKKVNVNAFKLENDFTTIENIKKTLEKYKNKFKYIVLCMNNRYQVNKILDIFEENFIFTDEKNLDQNKYNVIVKKISEGFIFEDCVYISENELFNTKAKQYNFKSKFKYGTKIKNLSKLEIGDFIVHNIYGIGKYCGLKTLNKNGVSKDYIQLEYKDKDKLYIPVENIEFISKYASFDSTVKLNKLGTEEWAKTKARARQKATDMADELLKLYAIRESKEGFSFPLDNELQAQFEKEFGYEETKDQLIAIENIKLDMEKNSPMDRLLCGDVGYGKTEVAFRAIFKAILGGKQVALLCPTTILSSQHYQNALNRFKTFPVRIGLLNRFITTKKVNELIRKVKSGEVDLLIGTHKILNDKVKFKDLGLLVIDEEQRFGVKQKEKIKQYKENIDILTLSATPIPRTLNMSLAGLRDLSTIETPPINRYPVQTYVLVENNKIIKEAIYKELARGGQTFILYNSVEHIESKMKEISSLVPDAKIVYAHGRMDKNVLEDIMYKFINKEFDVLICTTIIETGIDIPNANTLIIMDADRFGLSQLYQLRGRVGRTDRLAYCYLMYDNKKILTEIAVKRLNAIKEFTELGSGLSISLRDLSIRGAGNLLGSNQSGFIDDVGIELFTKMLKEEIDKLKGKYVEEQKEISPPLVLVDTSVSDEYVSEQELKIEIHKLINEVDSYEKLIEIRSQLEDRFGSISENLVIYMHEEWFQKIATKIGINQIKQNESFIELVLTKEVSSKLNGEILFLDLMKKNKNLRFKQQFNNLIIILPIKQLDNHFIYYLLEIVLIIEENIKSQ